MPIDEIGRYYQQRPIFCYECVFWLPSIQNQPFAAQGTCYQAPPQLLQPRPGESMSYRPDTTAMDFCALGEGVVADGETPAIETLGQWRTLQFGTPFDKSRPNPAETMGFVQCGRPAPPPPKAENHPLNGILSFAIKNRLAVWGGLWYDLGVGLVKRLLKIKK